MKKWVYGFVFTLMLIIRTTPALRGSASATCLRQAGAGVVARHRRPGRPGYWGREQEPESWQWQRRDDNGQATKAASRHGHSHDEGNEGGDTDGDNGNEADGDATIRATTISLEG